MNPYFQEKVFFAGAVLLVSTMVACRLGAEQRIYGYDPSGNLLAESIAEIAAPTILSQPQPGLLYSTYPVTLSVVAGGVGVSYQWYSNSVPVLGANGDSLVLTNLSNGNFTNFTVVISNAYGAVTSAPAAIWADSNGNGIPDWWEMKYFGNLNQPASGDYDGDGVSNIDEYREGTNPSDSISYNRRLHVQTMYGRVAVYPDQPYYTNGQVVTLTVLSDAGVSFLGWSGAASGTKPTISLVMNSHKTVTATFGVPFPLAVDNSNLVWTTGGDVPWFGQTLVSYDGVSAAQSGSVVNGQQSWLQAVATNLSQSFQLSFWWNVSSQPPDALTFSIDGVSKASQSGESASWRHVVTNLTFGTHTLLWVYAKDGIDLPSSVPFSDAAWLDQVTLTPIPTPPVITTNPMSQLVAPGSGATFRIGALGSQPIFYQWFVNGISQVGATNTLLGFTNLESGLSSIFAVVTNAYGVVTSSVASLAVNATTCFAKPAGLVAWWPGEGSANDVLGTNNGTIQGGAGFAPGEVGQAFHFDGIDQYVDVGNPAALQITGPLTLEAWFKTSSQMGSYKALVTKWWSGGTDAAYGLYWTPAGSLDFFLNSHANAQLDASSGQSWNDDNWHHVAGTWDGGTVRIYVDGVQRGSATNMSFGSIMNSARPFRIGADSYGAQDDFPGAVDEVSVYNRALGSNEVVGVYLAGAFGKCGVPVPPPSFGAPTWTSNGLQLWLTNLSAQNSLVVYASTNLTSWKPIFTNPPSTGTLQFLDSVATNFSERFYRAIEQ